ncbi:beta-N-acetylhexosaminidase [Gemmatimonadota bacterium]
MHKSTLALFAASLILFAACAAPPVRVDHTPLSLIPWPLSVERNPGQFALNNGTCIAHGQGLESEVRYLKGRLAELTGTEFEVLADAEAVPARSIALRLDSSLQTGPEDYTLVVAPGGVGITASTAAGVFYGIQTFLQLLPPEKLEGAKEVRLPALKINDMPQFGWRAYLLDDARWFHGVDAVKIMLEQMARLKMNRLHWYLTDDQGWRIEIERYPKLTGIGSKRRDSQVGEWRSEKRAGEPHEGFYSQAEIRDMVQFAAARHITIVPVISMPGHASAAIASYPQMGTSGEQIEVETTYGVKYNVFNVADEKVYTFLENILDEVMELFPSHVIHCGGDEVKFDQWLASSQVKALMKRENLSGPADVQRYFTNRMSRFLESRGRRMMGWNEILGHNVHSYQKDFGDGISADESGAGKLAPNALVNFWVGDIELARGAVEQGYDIVNSLHSSTYLDYSYEDISLEKAYAFDPIPEGLPAEYHNKVLGLGCQMWGEWIPTTERLEYQTFPRIAAYAEVGWSESGQKDYQRFLDALTDQKARWNRDGINYANVP